MDSFDSLGMANNWHWLACCSHLLIDTRLHINGRRSVDQSTTKLFACPQFGATVELEMEEIFQDFRGGVYRP